MPATKFDKTLGSGLYSVSEAAFYAKVKPALLSRWLFATGGRSVISPQFEFGKEDRLVSFLDFIQTLAIRDIRKQKKVPLEQIRNAIHVAEQRFGIDYPFARKHCTYLTTGNRLAICPNGKDFYEVCGKEAQKLFSFAEHYLELLEYDSGGLAKNYTVFKSKHKSPVSIVMDRGIRFGEPMLPSGYSALTIYDSIHAEGSEKRAAAVYGIPVQEAEAAKQFHDEHKRAA